MARKRCSCGGGSVLCEEGCNCGCICWRDDLGRIIGCDYWCECRDGDRHYPFGRLPSITWVTTGKRPGKHATMKTAITVCAKGSSLAAIAKALGRTAHIDLSVPIEALDRRVNFKKTAPVEEIVEHLGLTISQPRGKRRHAE